MQELTSKIHHMELFYKRHECDPILIADGAIFDESLTQTQILNPDIIYNMALQRLTDKKCQSLHLVISGLTVALVATLNACKTLGIQVTLLHFDRKRKEYYPQQVM